MTSWLVVCYVTTFLTYVTAYYNGAAHQSCETFDPGANHGFQGPNPVPYSIAVLSGNTYTNGEKITVQIKGPPFTGIILQARKKGMSVWLPVGWFSVPLNSSGLKLMSCVSDGDTITQKIAYNTLEESVITWIAPERDMGEIHFMANVFKTKDIWYNHIMSPRLTYQAPSTTTKMTTTTTTTTATTTTMSSWWRYTATPYSYSSSPSTMKGHHGYLTYILAVTLAGIWILN